MGSPKKFKIGHAGTLDPLASGLLLICTGKFTKRITELQGQAKEYTGTFHIGATTPSYDLETEVDQHFPTTHITEALIHETVQQFLGEIDQKPPIFSAIKKEGIRLYEHARAGETVEIASRKTTIHEFEITRIALPEVDFRVVCSKGTYIRTLGEDIGEALGCGAHLSALRRVATGAYHVAQCVTLADLEAMSEPERLACLLPVSSLLADHTVVTLDDDNAARFSNGLRRRGPWPDASIRRW